MNDLPNPYAAPTADSYELDALNDVDVIRQEHIRYETFVRAIGIVFYFLGGLMLSGFAVVLTVLQLPGTSLQVFGSGFFAFALIGIGYGLRHLKQWARFPAIFLSIVGLFIPFGTLLSVVILFVLFRRRHNIVFSEDYVEICRRTPSIRFAVPPIAVAILFLLVNGLLVSIIFPLLYFSRGGK